MPSEATIRQPPICSTYPLVCTAGDQYEQLSSLGDRQFEGQTANPAHFYVYSVSNGQTQWYLYCEPKHQSSRLTLSRGFDIEFSYSYFLFCCRAKCVCVVLDFWMHSIYKCTSKVFGIFMQKWRLDMGLYFVHVCVSEHLFPPYLFTIKTTRSAPLWAMCSTSSDIVH